MSTAGARILREDDNGMSREAVLLQWERKIEDAERRESGLEDAERHEAGLEDAERRQSGRFARAATEDGPVAEPVSLRPAEDATSDVPRRFERSTPSRAGGEADVERRTIKLAGQPTPARRRTSMVEAQMAQPDRIALWAFLLGLFLVAVAAGTAHT
jgi:hypothetical protein